MIPKRKKANFFYNQLKKYKGNKGKKKKSDSEVD